MATPSEVSAGPTSAASRPGVRAPLTLFTALLWAQGVYYLVTGVWPLVNIDTFRMVTGPKTDYWLVMTVGVLITAAAVTFLVAAWRRQNPPEVAILAVAGALGLAAIDVIYVARRVILPIYLADAAAEVILIAAWVVVAVRGFRAGRSGASTECLPDPLTRVP